MTTCAPNAFAAAAEWALEHSKERDCPSWCQEKHEQAILEGCPPESAYEHRGAEFGHILFDLHRPFDGHELVRAGGGRWQAWLEQVQGPNGWVDGTATTSTSATTKVTLGPRRASRSN